MMRTGDEGNRSNPQPCRESGSGRGCAESCPCVKPGTRQSIYRVKPNASSPWLVACPMCLGKFSEGNADLIFGGRISPVVARRWAQSSGTLCAPKVPLTVERSESVVEPKAEVGDGSSVDDDTPSTPRFEIRRGNAEPTS